MQYSIIIPVYNRLNEVRELLNSAEMLNFDRDQFELIFVDDGSVEPLGELVQNYQSSSHLNIRYFHQQNQGPGPARNLGMRQAAGDYFIFIDSDCLLPEHWLQSIHHSLQQNALDAFGGPDTCHPDFSPFLKAVNYAMTSFIGTGGTRGGKKSVGKFYPRSFNMGISRKVYETVGGMGSLRHGQDMEYSARIYRAGFRVGLIADAYVFHKRRTNLKRFFKQIFNWGVTRINLGRIDKKMWKPIHFAPLGVLFITLVAVGSVPFSWGIWVWPWVLAGGLLAGGIGFVESFVRYKSLPISCLSLVTLYMQVFGYGLGLGWGLIQGIRHRTVKGFTKNYYQ